VPPAGNCDAMTEPNHSCGPDMLAAAEEEPEPPPWLTLDIVRADGDWGPFEPCEETIAAAGRALAAHIPHAPREAAVALVSDARIRVLNLSFCGHDKPTNVLAFPAPETPVHRHDGATFLGDVVVAAETVTREAAEQGKPARDHLQHLVVHGLLHLMGRNHETDARAREMEALEIRILERIGVPDPYA
jgi:probable rRNA maturation factor